MLLITGEMWRMLDKQYPGDSFLTTSEEFLDMIGLPSGKSALYNPEERAFFDEIYSLWRTRDRQREEQMKKQISMRKNEQKE